MQSVPNWFDRLFISRERWYKWKNDAAIKASARGYITAINECTVEKDIFVDGFADKHLVWMKEGISDSLVQSLKLYMYQHGMTTRTIRDHVAWKDAHK